MVDYNEYRRLSAVMMVAAQKFLGRDVALSHNYVGLDTVKRDNPELVDDYIEARRLERSAGYEGRRRVFRERMIYLGVDRTSSTGRTVV